MLLLGCGEANSYPKSSTNPVTFTSHHWTGLKSLITGTLKAANHVGAGSVPTWVPDGALVCVWYGRKRTKRKDGQVSIP